MVAPQRGAMRKEGMLTMSSTSFSCYFTHLHTHRPASKQKEANSTSSSSPSSTTPSIPSMPKVGYRILPFQSTAQYAGECVCVSHAGTFSILHVSHICQNTISHVRVRTRNLSNFFSKPTHTPLFLPIK